MDPIPTVHTTALRHLKLLHRGKVRDIYEVDAQHMLIVTTDRLSAFDVVLPDPIPHKGRVLTEISNFWFARTGHIVPNQLSAVTLDALPLEPEERAAMGIFMAFQYPVDRQIPIEQRHVRHYKSLPHHRS